MDGFFDEKITIIKEDERRYEDVKAQVDKGKIFIKDVEIPVEDGDIIIRKLPIGAERYLVIDRYYQEAFGALPAIWEIEVKREKNKDSDREKTNEQINGSSDMKDEIKIFISHNSLDVELATALVKLLNSSLRIDKDEIRCTSVSGQGFDPGIDTNEAIRKEVDESAVLIGLLTPASLQSAFVLFELGARWGLRKPLIPLLAHGANFDDLPFPIRHQNAIKLDKEENLHDLIDTISKQLQINKEKTSSYIAEFKGVIEQALKKKE